MIVILFICSNVFHFHVPWWFWIITLILELCYIEAIEARRSA